MKLEKIEAKASIFPTSRDAHWCAAKLDRRDTPPPLPFWNAVNTVNPQSRRMPESPSIAVSAASGREAKDWLGVLANKKYKFIVGDYINSITNLYYSGSTASLNAFLADLSAVEGTTIRVSFSKESKTADSAFGSDEAHRGPCQWQIQHIGHDPEVFNITIFLGDGKIDLSELSLQTIRTPKTTPAAVKPAGVNVDELKPESTRF